MKTKRNKLKKQREPKKEPKKIKKKSKKKPRIQVQKEWNTVKTDKNKERLKNKK